MPSPTGVGNSMARDELLSNVISHRSVGTRRRPGNHQPPSDVSNQPDYVLGSQRPISTRLIFTLSEQRNGVFFLICGARMGGFKVDF